jgi:lysophospholipase L1-like esterase
VCRAASIAVAARGVAAKTAVLALIALPVLTGCASGPSAPDPSSGTSYYVSLGDSLSQGVQPDPGGNGVRTSHGYADQLYAALQRGDPGLRLVKLGCPGETTTTMIKGGLCRYPDGSQLAAAASFLRAHVGHVSLITIDIGSNDLTAYIADCQSSPSFAAGVACLKARVPPALANLAKILTTLLAAAGTKVRIIGMTYYDPMLSQWTQGPAGQVHARESEEVVQAYNQMLAGVYEKYGARVADVFGAFHSTNFSGNVTLPAIGAVPPNVAAICTWTWECAKPPRGPNVHADTVGYQVIARAFLRADS